MDDWSSGKNTIHPGSYNSTGKGSSVLYIDVAAAVDQLWNKGHAHIPEQRNIKGLGLILRNSKTKFEICSIGTCLYN